MKYHCKVIYYASCNINHEFKDAPPHLCRYSYLTDRWHSVKFRCFLASSVSYSVYQSLGGKNEKSKNNTEGSKEGVKERKGRKKKKKNRERKKRKEKKSI